MNNPEFYGKYTEAPKRKSLRRAHTHPYIPTESSAFSSTCAKNRAFRSRMREMLLNRVCLFFAGRISPVTAGEELDPLPAASKKGDKRKEKRKSEEWAMKEAN